MYLLIFCFVFIASMIALWFWGIEEREKTAAGFFTSCILLLCFTAILIPWSISSDRYNFLTNNYNKPSNALIEVGNFKIEISLSDVDKKVVEEAFDKAYIEIYENYKKNHESIWWFTLYREDLEKKGIKLK